MDETPETWLPIPGYEGHYEVSDQGRVKSLKLSPRLLKPRPNSHGYVYVDLCLNGVSTRTLHGVVLLAFIGPRPEGLETRHLDGDNSNNTLKNLVYGTKSENEFDRVRHGTHQHSRKTHCIKGHPFDEANTYRDGHHRQCRTCVREGQKARYKAKKAVRS